MQTKMCCVSDRVDYTKKFLTYMEQLRRDVLKKRGLFGGDPTTNAKRVLNVALTSDFKFIHLVIITTIEPALGPCPRAQ